MSSWLVRAVMALYGLRYWQPVERMTRHPDTAQSMVMRGLLARNQNTRFGREHGFAGVRTYADFRSRVPVQDYEMLRPYIDEQRRTGARSLTEETPLFYAQTSGSTGTPKYIPITPTALTMHRQEQALFSYLQFEACPDAFAGRALGIMGAAVEGQLDTGHTVGSVSGHLYQSLPRVVQTRFVVPPAVTTIPDYELKYLTILHLALSAPDITYLGAPNPSTFLKLLDLLNNRRELLIDTLMTGGCSTLERLQPQVREAVRPRLRSDPVRAKQLSRLTELTFANVWPGIRLVTTWTGGSCGIALGALRTKLPAATMVMELGYQSTECRGTLALAAETAAGLPALHHHLFEFVSASLWDAGTRAFLQLSELTVGQQYYVIVTTAAGLYRYFMNDLVEVTGLFHGTPLLRFVQKGKGVTSLTGEKLYESQVIQAVQDAAREHGISISFFIVVADDQIAGYTLFVEILGGTRQPDGLAARVDRRLGELNIEYHSKRASGRLQPLKMTVLKSQAADAYKAACVLAGQREGQFKPVVLQYRQDLKWDVYGYGAT
jgi:GH3 auxin-responsive promoter